MIEVYQSEQELLLATANLIIKVSEEAIRSRGRFSLVLSGGKTPDALYKMLSQPEWADRIQWSQTDVFWGDERYVPENDLRNNAFVALTLLLDKVSVPKQQIHRMPVRTSPEEDAKAYQQVVEQYFGAAPKRFDLIFLGLGENGHTASLFPYTDVIHEKAQLIKEVWVEEVGMYRITMTADLINKASNVVFLVQGESKATVVEQVINGPKQPEKLPAQLIKSENGTTYWLLDAKAAAALSSKSFS